MKLKKRTKRSRIRGTRLCGYAAKKHKGKGNRGGVGMAGTGKRADQKKTYILKYEKNYFGKKPKTKRTKEKVINVGDIKGKGEIILKGYKVLSGGEVKEKITIKADSFSKKAKEKIEKAGGKAILLSEKKEKK